MHWHDLESLNWRAHCTWLIATVHILIVLARTCDESSQGDACIEAQPMLPTMDCPTCVDWRRGLSAQNGALRPLSNMTPWADFHETNFMRRVVAARCSDVLRPTRASDRRGGIASFTKQVTPIHPAP